MIGGDESQIDGYFYAPSDEINYVKIVSGRFGELYLSPVSTKKRTFVPNLNE